MVDPQDKPDKNNKYELIYGTKCACEECPASYVGETKQVLVSCFKQHRMPTTNEVQESVVYHRINTTGHQFYDSEVIILDRRQR